MPPPTAKSQQSAAAGISKLNSLIGLLGEVVVLLARWILFTLESLIGIVLPAKETQVAGQIVLVSFAACLHLGEFKINISFSIDYGNWTWNRQGIGFAILSVGRHYCWHRYQRTG